MSNAFLNTPTASLFYVVFEISSVSSSRAREVDQLDLNPHWVSGSSLYLSVKFSNLLLNRFSRIFESHEGRKMGVPCVKSCLSPVLYNIVTFAKVIYSQGDSASINSKNWMKLDELTHHASLQQCQVDGWTSLLLKLLLCFAAKQIISGHYFRLGLTKVFDY